MIAAGQLLLLAGLAGLLAAWARAWPYPSPAIRWLLPARQRWPEAHVRDMLASGALHPAYLRFFNRDPVRDVPIGGDALAPADGLLLSAERRGETRYLVVALSFWDVHVQRSPLAGRVVSIETLGDTYRDGEGRDFAFLATKACPVQKRIILDSDHGSIAVRLITSLAARRIEVWPAVGESVARGERIGRILLGSTVVLEVPADWAIQARVGTRVHGGLDALVMPPGVTAPAR